MSGVGRWLIAIALAAVGVVAGWLIATGIFALSLPEGAIFGLAAVAAVIFLVAGVFWRRWPWRAALFGAFVGIAGTVVLVLLIVKGVA